MAQTVPVAKEMNRAARHHEIMAELENMKKSLSTIAEKYGKPKPARRKLTERKKLIKQLDQAVREVVFQDDPHICVTCGKTDNLQLGHLITRSRYGTRWDLMNCHIQCAGCNYRHEFQPEIYTSWFLLRFGEDVYQALCQRAESQGKYTIDELETKLMELSK